MSKSNFKKAISIILVVIMLFSAVPMGVFAAEASLPMIKAFTSVAGDFHAYKTEIVTVTILDYIDEEEYTACSPYAWDISASSSTGTVKAWMKVNAEETAAAGATRYDVYMGGSGGIAANAYSADLFWNFKKLKEIKGLENFDTSNATNFSYMFNMCESLEKLDLSSWDTSKVTTFLWMFNSCFELEELNILGWDTSSATNMNSMFKNCKSLTELDISSFDTSNVTNMNSMFFNCIVLSDLYVGEGWNTGNVKDGGQAFNCCDALPGFDPMNSQAGIEFADKYVKPAPEKPVTEKYTVTYSFTGEYPADAVLPVSVEYEKGTTVVVEADSVSQDASYIFNGWTSEDADISTGSFAIENNVEIVGSWTKLYKVEYKYDERYEVPAGAPTEDMLATLSSLQKAGDDVDVFGVLPAPERYIFVGWYTKDADVAGNMFTMPEKDVTLYGYFKIPVESIEINHIEDTIVFDKNDTKEQKINVYVNPEDATIKDIIYESSDESVVKIDNNGYITMVGEGTATITVYSKDDPSKGDSIEVTVKTSVTKLEVDKTDITLNKDDTDEIIVTIEPDTATNKDVTFESKDEKVAKVDENGNITGVGQGTTTIVVTSKDNPELKKEVNVTVKIPVTEVEAGEDFDLNIGDEKQLEVSVNEDATNKELTYESNDPGVVKVDSTGNVIAVGEGTAIITVTSKDDPNKKDTIEITVYRTYQVSYEYIGTVPADATELPETVRYRAGEKVSVAYNATAEGYTFSGWSTDVDVTAGEFTMPARDVVLKGSFKKDVTDITIIVEDDELEIGETGKIEVTVTPDDADNKEVIYESSDETVVKVDKDGNIEAIGEGTATITVTSKDNATIVEKITVTVEKPVVDEPEVDNPDIDEPDIDEPDDDKPDVNYIMEYPISVVVKEGETKNLGVKVVPEEGAPAVKYTSSDESIVVVDADGNITGVAEGKANITAELPSGNFVVIAVTVTFKTSHYIVFGKTEKIGWYSVSMDGGETFMTVFGNSNLEVAEGTELLIRANDVLGDPFTFYINGNGTTPDENGYVRVVVDGYMLIGALGVPVIAPDTEESLNLIQRLIKSIKDFFARIASFFGF